MRGVLGAIFLACSWCWCIGMFFPVLMVRDFGVAGWIVFLIPNAIGAMLVGVYHRRAGSVERFLECHLPAARAFSVVTVCFHAAFLVWITDEVLGVERVLWHALPALVVLAAAWWAARLRFEVMLAVGLLVYAISMGCAASAVLKGDLFSGPVTRGDFRPRDLAAMAPVVVLGFLTCPHLDLTFLRLRREMEARDGTRAFVLGFALLFPLLMVVTLGYAGDAARGGWTPLVLVHLVVQAWFTVALHVREWAMPACVSGTPQRPDPGDGSVLRWRRHWTMAAAAALVVVGAWVMGLWQAGVFTSQEELDRIAAERARWNKLMSAPRYEIEFEEAYKFFITFYGVIFPAYLVAAFFARGRPRWWVVALACALALPFAAAGYLYEQWQWLWGVVPAVLAPLWTAARAARRQNPLT